MEAVVECTLRYNLLYICLCYVTWCCLPFEISEAFQIAVSDVSKFYFAPRLHGIYTYVTMTSRLPLQFDSHDEWDTIINALCSVQQWRTALITNID